MGSVTNLQKTVITSIGDSAFRDCKSLSGIILPQTVSSLGDYCFANCSSLKLLFLNGSSVPDCSSNAFYGTLLRSDKSATISAPARALWLIEHDEAYASWAELRAYHALRQGTAIPISQVSFANLPDCYFDGTAQEPSVSGAFGPGKLTEGVDYTVEYYNNAAVGTASVYITGRGYFTGTTVKDFQIQRKINLATAQVSGIVPKAYTGAAQTQAMRVVLDGKTLKQGEDLLGKTWEVCPQKTGVDGKWGTYLTGLLALLGKTWEVCPPFPG